VWTGEYDLNTLRVDGEIFESATKKLRIRKYPYTCGQGLRYSDSKTSKFIRKCMAIRTLSDPASGCHTFLCKFWRFWIAVSQSKLAWLTPNLGILWISVCSFWRCGSIVANSIIKRLVPSPSRFENRQCHAEEAITRPRQLSMAATARVIWLCACVRYWPDRWLVFECVTFFIVVLPVFI